MVRGDVSQDGPPDKKEVGHGDDDDIEDVASQEAPDGHIEGPPRDQRYPHRQFRKGRDHGEHKAADKGPPPPRGLGNGIGRV